MRRHPNTPENSFSSTQSCTPSVDNSIPMPRNPGTSPRTELGEGPSQLGNLIATMNQVVDDKTITTCMIAKQEDVNATEDQQFIHAHSSDHKSEVGRETRTFFWTLMPGSSVESKVEQAASHILMGARRE